MYCTNSFPHVCNNGIFDEVRLKHTLVLHEIMHKISQKKQMKVFFGVYQLIIMNLKGSEVALFSFLWNWAKFLEKNPSKSIKFQNFYGWFLNLDYVLWRQFFPNWFKCSLCIRSNP